MLRSSLKETWTIESFRLHPSLYPLSHFPGMNCTIRYSFPDDLKFRYMSFPTYAQALKCIDLFKQIDVKAEVKTH